MSSPVSWWSLGLTIVVTLGSDGALAARGLPEMGYEQAL